MNEIERIAAFKQAKKEYTNFLAKTLWQLADSQERFAQSMHCALFGLWREIEKVRERGPHTFKVLYRIALSANALAWQETLPRADSPPASRLSQMREEIGQAVRKAIAELPVQESEAVVMRFIGRKPIAEIAHTLGISKHGAEKKVLKAVETLKHKVRSESISAA